MEWKEIHQAELPPPEWLVGFLLDLPPRLLKAVFDVWIGQEPKYHEAGDGISFLTDFVFHLPLESVGFVSLPLLLSLFHESSPHIFPPPIIAENCHLEGRT